MARVHKVAKAAKDYPEIGVSKGEPYYWVKQKIMAGGRWYSRKTRFKNPPTASQLTQSEFQRGVLDIEAAIDAAEDPDALESVAEDAESLGAEQREKFENMPEGLQQGSTGELLDERANACEEWAEAIRTAAEAWREAEDAAGDAHSEYTGWENDEPDEIDTPEYDEWQANEPDAPDDVDADTFKADAAYPG